MMVSIGTDPPLRGAVSRWFQVGSAQRGQEGCLRPDPTGTRKVSGGEASGTSPVFVFGGGRCAPPDTGPQTLPPPRPGEQNACRGAESVDISMTVAVLVKRGQ